MSLRWLETVRLALPINLCAWCDLRHDYAEHYSHHPSSSSLPLHILRFAVPAPSNLCYSMALCYY